jgi:hypothetical protein
VPRRVRAMFMSKEFTDPDIIEPTADTRVEHNSEVIVAIGTVQQSQVQLNVLADQKANINIGFTLLFLSLNQSSIVADAATVGIVRWGVLVVTPRTNRLRIREPQQMGNPFYFGMFTQLKQDVYVDHMLSSLIEDKRARRMMLVDVYQIGQVLTRKYRLLRFSYSFLALSALLSATLFIYKMLSS